MLQYLLSPINKLKGITFLEGGVGGVLGQISMFLTRSGAQDLSITEDSWEQDHWTTVGSTPANWLSDFFVIRHAVWRLFLVIIHA